ncbi:MAG TPA: Gp138 family membrane-puncturing spike protein [Polyangia bacterium]|nr:Gp138 family membrane-puncturing spike protein [Polyangia bacterium]
MSDDNAANIQRDLELAATPEDAATAAARELLKDVHTALPGIIESFDATTQTARVRPAIRRVWVEQGPMDLPPCVDVPVHFPAGGSFVLTFPVGPGDECLLCFSERAIDAWYDRGGVQNPSEYRLHDYSDGFAFVGFSSKPNAVGLFATDAAEFRTRDGTTVFRLEAGTAYVGGKVGAEKAVRGESYRQAQAAMHQELLAALQIVAAAPTTMTDSPFTLALKALMPMWIASIQAFELGAPTYLAQKARVF